MSISARPLHLLFLLLLLAQVASASSLDLSSLDSCIAARPQIDARYERNLAGLKQQLAYSGNDHAKRLRLTEEIFQKYSSYQFDSALVYVKKYQAEAIAAYDNHSALKATFQKAQLLAYGGFYNNAEEILEKIDFNTVPVDLRFDYVIAAYWTYVFWSAFTMDGEFSKRMDGLRTHYLALALKYVKKGSVDWYYLKGEESYFKGEQPTKAIAWYKRALKHNHQYGKFYSQVTFAIARGYKQMNMNDKYGYYLMLSARSHILSSVKENAAMQDLAMYIFSLDPDDNATLAHHYLIVAMDDATFFNNKLRKLEISNRLPPIVTAYQRQLARQHRMMWAVVIVTVVLAIGAFSLYLLSKRRNAQLHLSQKLLEHKNSQLNTANGQLQAANGELSRLNGLLREANRKREEYLRLFVDICASTMDRITSYRNYVKLKVKANQTKDLLRVVNSDRIAAQDMNRFYIQFDKAFLGLYPDFVDEFSKLLRPECPVSLNKDGSLTTELRIFALIRLGVTESSEIATLLSYSPHTIYNYRSAMKGRAINKDGFEDDVRNLCSNG